MSAELRPLPPGQDLLRVSEVAAALGCKPRVVLTWLQRGGKFTGAVRTPGGQWRGAAGRRRRGRAQFGITDDGSG